MQGRFLTAIEGWAGRYTAFPLQTEAAAVAFSVQFSGVMIGYGSLQPFLKLLNTQPTSDAQIIKKINAIFA